MDTWKVRARRESDWHRAMSLEHLEFRHLDCSTYVLFSLACSPLPLSCLYCVFCLLLRLCLRRHRRRTSVSGRCKSKFAGTVSAVFIASLQGVCPLQVFGILSVGFCAVSDRGCESVLFILLGLCLTNFSGVRSTSSSLSPGACFLQHSSGCFFVSFFGMLSVVFISSCCLLFSSVSASLCKCLLVHHLFRRSQRSLVSLRISSAGLQYPIDLIEVAGVFCCNKS
jgi:hypothetical protein